ncbi:hypothetical protein SASPL_140742 [Salvia splendens]|uniref:DUF4378 domain-containing protein n=1 Tax=Salvia splendens TaxID=180675 RepID=A0A8X8ZBW6_SALSN|nr:uncharacterized protein LOC121768225 isoform X1 [Salvia splendens]KAG6399266.1 hypothetical protein SASPL_140742 [Salvia splendens]
MDSKLIKHKAFPKPSLLKDYLMDDMSSCSSNGFKSFPRRQCCPSTVRFLVEINPDQHKKYSIFNKSPSKSAASAFQRVIAAVKRFPFGSPDKPILPSSLSRKILRKTIFWKRNSSHKEIQRLKSFDQLMKEDSPPLDIPTDFNACSSGNSSNFTEVKREEDDVDVEMLKDGNVTTDDSSTGGATESSTEQKQWSASEEKEQFSPVSVLDCPFDDDEVSSPFPHMEGSRKPKIERFGGVDPLNLSKRFESTESPLPHSSVSSTREEEELEEDEVKRAEQKAMDLLQQVMPPCKADRLLLDFFREKIMSRQWGEGYCEDMVREAESWINSTALIRDALLGWNRQPYVEDMEGSKEWRCFDGEIREMALELEAVVFDALFDELVVDISSVTVV